MSKLHLFRLGRVIMSVVSISESDVLHRVVSNANNFSSSMSLQNRGRGLDMNVMAAWERGITGKGVVVSILDDGIERDHPDLKQNYVSRSSVCCLLLLACLLCSYRSRGLVGSALDHRLLPPEFESQRGHI